MIIVTPHACARGKVQPVVNTEIPRSQDLGIINSVLFAMPFDFAQAIHKTGNNGHLHVVDFS